MTGCVSSALQLPRSIRWFRYSAEQKAAYEQTFSAATQAVQESSRALTAERWGVVLDVDETVLDNSPYEMDVALRGERYSSATWAAWVREQRAGVLPGARAFISVVKELGGQVVLVTNRSIDLCAETEANLRNEGIAYDLILCDRDGSGDKQARFQSVEEGIPGFSPIDVVVWIGDNIEDFPTMSQEAANDFGDFGVRYFVVPNPMYGSWLSVGPP